MLSSLGERATQRKLLLFACACARRVWPLLPDPRWRDAAEVAESHAEGAASEAEFRAALHAAYFGVWDGSPPSLPPAPVDWWALVTFAAERCAALAGRAWGGDVEEYHAAEAAERVAQAGIVRDLFPLRPVALDPRWLTRDVLTIARSIHAHRALADLPALGDALEEAGCDCAEVLDHCHGGGPHFLGCRVLDLVTGRG
jgi:hypothetical protein